MNRRAVLAAAAVAAAAFAGHSLSLFLAVSTGVAWWLAVAGAASVLAVAAGLFSAVRLLSVLDKGHNALDVRVARAESEAETWRAELAGLRQDLTSLTARVGAADEHAALNPVIDRLVALEARSARLELGIGQREQENQRISGEVAALVERVNSLAERREHRALDEVVGTTKKRMQILTARSRRSLLVLAEAAAALGTDLTEVISLPDAQLLLNDCVERQQAVRAIPVIEAFDLLPRQNLTQLRRLYAAFRASGHWDVALRTVELIAERSQKSGDRWAAQRSREELEVFAGPAPTPPVAAAPARDAGGPVLHLVGKVLPVTQSGYTLRTQHTVRAQLRRGIRAVVVAQSGSADGDGGARYSHDGVEYVVLPGPDRREVGLRTWMQANVEQLSALVQHMRPSIIHAHSDFLNAYVAHAVGVAHGIPIVYEVRGFWEESWLSRTARSRPARTVSLPSAYVLRRRAEERARVLPDHLFTLADVMKRHITESSGGMINEESVSVVPNAVTPASFPKCERDGDLAALLGIPEDALTIGYISSLVEYEGIDTLIEAFRQVRSSTEQPLRLLLVGDGQYADALREHAQAGGADGIIFTGAVPHEEVPRYYSLIDIFVVPRRKSSVTELVTPLKPFEAFSTGTPVVLSDVGALREIAEDSGAAELFTPGDPASLAQVLLQLIAQPQRRQALGAAGADWVRAHRTWDGNADAYLEAYRRLGYTGAP